MNRRRGAGRLAIWTTFLVGLILTALPLPDWALLWRPAWVALVLIYWCMALPQRVGVGIGWGLGLLLDVLTDSLLGQHALALSVMAFITHKSHQRIRVLPVLQQGISVFGLVLVYQLLVLWINGIRGLSVDAVAYLTAPATSMLLWPWIFIILRDIRRKFGVS